MSVLVEGHSIIARVDAIERVLPGGVAALAAHVPNRSFCADPYLARVGFLEPREAMAYAATLRRIGLAPVDETGRGVFVLVPQGEPCEPCAWLDVAVLEFGDGRQLTLASLRAMPNVGMAVPLGWEWHDSASAAPHLLGEAAGRRRRHAGRDAPQRALQGGERVVLMRDLARPPQQAAQPAVAAIEFARCMPDGVRGDLAPAAG